MASKPRLRNGKTDTVKNQKHILDRDTCGSLKHLVELHLCVKGPAELLEEEGLIGLNHLECHVGLHQVVGHAEIHQQEGPVGLHQQEVEVDLHQQEVEVGLHHQEVEVGLHHQEVEVGLHHQEVEVGLHQQEVEVGLHQQEVKVGLHQQKVKELFEHHRDLLQLEGQHSSSRNSAIVKLMSAITSLNFSTVVTGN